MLSLRQYQLISSLKRGKKWYRMTKDCTVGNYRSKQHFTSCGQPCLGNRQDSSLQSKGGETGKGDLLQVMVYMSSEIDLHPFIAVCNWEFGELLVLHGSNCFRSGQMPVTERGYLLQAHTVVSSTVSFYRSIHVSCVPVQTIYLQNIQSNHLVILWIFYPLPDFRSSECLHTHKHINIQDQQSINCAL